MTISDLAPVGYYAKPQTTIRSDGISVAIGHGERADLTDVVTVAVTSGPMVIEIHLSSDDALKIAEALCAANAAATYTKVSDSV
ncbi:MULTISPECIES: hypothetical protein [Rhodococcus]|uniref:hypothetical protein n=1 Tax=Rhodococcus TaxID=1827 RepID=UPI001E3A039E|nr:MULTISPECIES: hypothetical protein [Rhodococcus]BDB58975.1 hypothetical protein RDE2_07690 [Rhodococcus sp. RDE2]